MLAALLPLLVLLQPSAPATLPATNGAAVSFDSRSVGGGSFPMFGHVLRNKWYFKSNFTQLNHGAYGATPRSVLNAQWGYMQQMESGMERWMNTDSPGIVDGSSAGLINRSRYALAAYVNAPPEDVVLVRTQAPCNCIPLPLYKLTFSDTDRILVLVCWLKD